MVFSICRRGVVSAPSLASPKKLAMLLTTTMAISFPVLVRLGVIARLLLVKNRTDEAYNFEIGLLIPAPDIIDLARAALFEHALKRRAMIGDVNPVADVLAVTIDRYALIGESPMNDEWNQFFRKLEGSIIVGTVDRKNRKPVSMIERAAK